MAMPYACEPHPYLQGLLLMLQADKLKVSFALVEDAIWKLCTLAAGVVIL